MKRLEDLIPGLEIIDDNIIITDDNGVLLYQKKEIDNAFPSTTKEMQVLVNGNITNIKIKRFSNISKYIELSNILKSLLSYERHIYIIEDKKGNILFSNRSNIYEIEKSIEEKYGLCISGNCIFEWQGCWYRLEKRIIRSENKLYNARIYRDITETYRTRKESETDFLTKLYNKKGLLKRLDLFKNSGEQFAIIFADIDFFKQVNDKIGHIEADIVLSKIGEILKQNTRSIDVASRFGGEEFVVLLNNCSENEAYQKAESLRKQIEMYDFGVNFPITMSFGIDICNTNKTIAESKENADKALYISKNSGRNKVTLYDDSVG